MSNQFIEAFQFVSDRWSDLIAGKVVEHLEVSAEAVAIAIVIGVPLGCVLGHLHRFSFLAINTSNLARALPTVAILALLFPYTGIGDATSIIALVILAAPPILTNCYVAVDGVEPDVVDAARGNGLNPWQVLVRAELPLALPLIFAGVRVASVFVVATATLKGFFGGGGLGDIISNPASYRIPGVIGASYVLIALAVVVQLVFLVVEYAVTPTALRRRPGRAKRGAVAVTGASTPAPSDAAAPTSSELRAEPANHKEKSA